MHRLKKKANFKQDIKNRFNLVDPDDLKELDELITALDNEDDEINQSLQEPAYYADYGKNWIAFLEYKNFLLKQIQMKHLSDASSPINDVATSDKKLDALPVDTSDNIEDVTSNIKDGVAVDEYKNEMETKATKKKQSKYDDYTLTRVEPDLYHEVTKAAKDYDQRIIPFLNAVIEIGLKKCNDMDIVQTIVTQRKRIAEKVRK